MNRRIYQAAFLTVGLSLVSAPAWAQAGREVTFTGDVLPILQSRCISCHGDMARGGLRLDTYANLMKGGAKGPSIVPKSATTSRLVQMITGTAQPRMPVGGAPLTQVEILKISAWVEQGAKNDADVAAAASANAPAPALTILEPKEGAAVREKVKISVPRAAVPNEGFLAVYVDGNFVQALAPPTPEDLDEKKLPPDAPINYTWDSKQALTDATTVSREKRFPADGKHTIEIRTYRQDGAEVGRLTRNVILQNRVTTPTNKMARLWYDGTIGRQYVLKHEVDVEASAIQGGARPAGGAITAASAAVQTGQADKMTHKENARYLVSIEDVMPGVRTTFWRERLESPLTVIVNNLKNVVRTTASSRYYHVKKDGESILNKDMERQKRQPIVNPIDLPGRLAPTDKPFNTELRIHLGAYIPGVLTVENVQAVPEGVEWQNGEPCLRLKVSYLAGKGKVDINSWGMRGVEFNIEQGTSTIWFSEITNRVIMARHDLTGSLVVEGGQMAAPGAGAFGSPGGEFGPADFGTGAPMAPGGYSALPGLTPGNENPGDAGLGGTSGAAGLPAGTKQRFHVKLKVETVVDDSAQN